MSNVCPVFVSERVLDGLEAVRESGETNMFDYNAAIMIASKLGYDDTVEWMLNNKEGYLHGIMVGFKMEE